MAGVPNIITFEKILTIYIADNGTQTDDSIWPNQRGFSNQALKHDHEEENNRQVMNELKVLSRHLVDYNKRTFGKFIQDIEKEYRERINANKKLRCEINDLKTQLQEAEKARPSAQA